MRSDALANLKISKNYDPCNHDDHYQPVQNRLRGIHLFLRVWSFDTKSTWVKSTWSCRIRTLNYPSVLELKMSRFWRPVGIQFQRAYQSAALVKRWLSWGALSAPVDRKTALPIAQSHQIRGSTDAAREFVRALCGC
jgi:hypothetical protein